MAKVAVHARFQAEPGPGDELVTAIDDMFDADRAALDTHGRSGAAQRFGARLDELLAEEPEVGSTHLLRAGGLPVAR